MAFSRQEYERQQAREEARRQEALARRQEEDRERAREDARREEDRRERLAFEAQLEAAKVKREALIARLSEQRRREREVAARFTERRARLLDQIRNDDQERRRASAGEAARANEAVETLRVAARDAKRSSEREAARDAERAGAARRAEQPNRSVSTDPERLVGPPDDRATTERRDRERSDRARKNRTELARRDAVAAERAAAAREARRLALSAARLEEDRASRKVADRSGQVRAQATADRRTRRRDEERLAQAVAEQVADRRQHQRAGRTAAASIVTERQTPRRERPATRPREQLEPANDPLDDPIPSGVLSGSLPWLRVAGTRLETVGGHPVTLRGASVLGLGPPGRAHDLAAAGLDNAGLEALLGLGLRAIRVPIDRDRYLVGAGGGSATERLAELDRIVDRAAGHGAYTILSLETLGDATFGTLPDGSGGRRPNPIAPRPDYTSGALWRSLADRYGDEPAVLFDLFASPHAPLPDDPTKIETDWDHWAVWVRFVVGEIRRAHPRAVCIVAGLDWATDLSGFPILGTANEPIPNLVYGAAMTGARPTPQLRALATRLPILVTELEMPAALVAVRAATLAALGIGWIAAARPDRPFMAASGAGRLEPTTLGMSIQRALVAIPDRPPVEPPRRPRPAFATAV